MGRWGLRDTAILCVLVWILTACGPLLPATPAAPPVDPTASPSPQTGSPPTAPRAARTATPTARPQPREASLPAPQYYTVVAGDTQADIAARFGLSLDTLRTANGDLPPDILYPGQVLLIPIETSAFATSVMSASFPAQASQTLVRFLPTHTPQPLSLPVPVCTRSPVDEVLCLGWVQNTTADHTSGVVVQIGLYDADGLLLVVQAGVVAQQVIPPGAGAPYAVRIVQAPDYARAEAALLSASRLDDLAASPALPLTVTLTGPLSPGSDARAPVHVRGTIRHGGQQDVRQIVLVATLLDDDDRVTGFRVERLDQRLPAGDTLAVDVLVAPLLAGTTRAVLYAEAAPAIEAAATAP